MRNENGFTLIEIIAVLVILGVLVAIAVPKYVSLMDYARNKSANAALAEGMARVNMVAAKQILSTGSVTDAAAVKSALDADATYQNAGDFSLTYAASGATGIAITASGTAGNVSGGSTTGSVGLPTT